MSDVKVTVTEGVRVIGPDGMVRRGGDEVTVPESVAEFWSHCGWASETGPTTLPDPRGLTGGGPEPQVEMPPPRTAPRRPAARAKTGR